jgi:8-oxo-dGTP pyrophosphatase MutT (NUDIX family)
MLDIRHIQQKLPQQLDNNKYAELFRNLTNMQDVSQWHGAVNIIFVDGKVLFIKRSETMPSHSGQIAFIGGTRNRDENDPIAVAMREFEEESAINSNELNILGLMPPVYTAYMKRIISVVSECRLSFTELSKQIESNGEWDLAFATDASSLMDPTHWSYAQRFGENGTSTVLYREIRGEEYDLVKTYQELDASCSMNFWGASARMLWNLFRVASN